MTRLLALNFYFISDGHVLTVRGQLQNGPGWYPIKAPDRIQQPSGFVARRVGPLEPQENVGDATERRAPPR